MVYCPGENVKILEYFVKARDLNSKWNIYAGSSLSDWWRKSANYIQLIVDLDTGFYDYEPDRVK